MNSKNESFFKELEAYNIFRYEGKLLYKYVTIETSIKILSSNTLKFSTAEELKDNDMDMSLLEVNLTDTQVALKKERDFKKILKEKIRLTDSEIDFRISSPFGKNFLNNISTETYRRQIKDSYKTLQRDFRFFCTTTSNNNQKMWDKYGDNSSGVCIEYTLPLECYIYYALKVYYDGEYKSFGMFNNPDMIDEIAMQRWYFTKKLEYAFEQEVRLFTHKQFRLLEIPKTWFTGISYGTNTKQSDIDAIEKILKDFGYSFKGIKTIY